jgi:hypothetical protein
MFNPAVVFFLLFLLSGRPGVREGMGWEPHVAALPISKRNNDRIGCQKGKWDGKIYGGHGKYKSKFLT